MTRPRALVIVIVLWALIYLPGLGSTEIKGEEGRRILPAITMLETGNWVVPHVGGKPFLRKPPLANWAIAASFKLTGVRNEWTARLPSALCVLMLALTMVALSSGQGWINAQTGLTAAIFAMTQLGLLSKARFAGAEIEGIYVPLYGMAMVCWIAWWSQRRSPWLTWTVPFVFLGLAALAKAPLHLLFFYAIVVAVLWRQHALRQLLSVPHIIGVLIAIGIFAAWAVPYFQTEEAMNAGKVWKDQFAGRVTANAFDWKRCIVNTARAAADQLPWLLFVPLLFMRRAAGGAMHESAQPRLFVSDGLRERPPAAFLAIAVCFFGLLLLPGVLTRYVLPLGVPLCILVAIRLHENEVDGSLRAWRRIHVAFAWLLVALALAAPIAAAFPLDATHFHDGLRRLDHTLVLRASLVSTAVLATCAVIVARRPLALQPSGLAITSAALLGAAALLYATAAVRWINSADNVRPLAAEIDASIAAARHSESGGRETGLILFDPGWEPAIFYLRTKYEYAANVSDIPRDAEFVLARAEDEKERGEQLAKFARRRPDLELVKTIQVRAGEALLLLRRRETISKDARP